MNYPVWIVDFGSQYTQLITRKARELGHESFVLTPDQALESWAQKKPKAIILSGGPQSVSAEDQKYKILFENNDVNGIPTLGICFGMQLISQLLGGEVEAGAQGEYGPGVLKALGHDFNFLNDSTVWMSHGDHVKAVPSGFATILESSDGLIAGIKKGTTVGLQFHPEVVHTDLGDEVLTYFFHDIAKLKPTWNSQEMLKLARQNLKTEKKEGKILCAFSGGVDSLVAATLAAENYGDQLVCVFVDHGLVRPQDQTHIQLLQKETNLPLEVVDASTLFLKKLEGVFDPEEKRKIIGNTFIDVFEEKVREIEQREGGKFRYLLQGTLYPDVIESKSPHQIGGKSVTIKSHHNVGGLPEKMNLEVLEPLKWFFKDEVRKIGKGLGLPDLWVNRHPFPGPGLSLRIIGELTLQKLDQAKQADQILFEELLKFDLYHKTWQALVVVLPVQTVGVKGDQRVYEGVLCLRLVDSQDGMTARWSRMTEEFLDSVSRRLTNEVKGITRVVFDLTNKPPGTIEWE